MPGRPIATPAFAAAATRPSGGVRPQMVVWALVLLAVALFWPTLTALSRIWLGVADYQYGFLAAGIAAWLLFRSAAHIDASSVRPQPLVLPLLAMTLVAWMVSYRANSDMLQQLLFPVVLFLSIYVALGLNAARAVAFPIAYFAFAIPLWDHFVPPLQWLTTQAAENILAALNVPTIVDGHHVTIPAGTFSIIEGCSGKRYFIIGLSFAALAGWLQGVRRGRLIGLLAAAGVIAILTNWIRVVIVIYAGHVSNMQHYLVAVEHKSLGYALFIPMLLLIAWIARRLAGDDVVGDAKPAVTTLSPGQGVRLAAGPAALFVACLAWLFVTRPVADSGVALGAFPLLVGVWQGPLPANQRWQPEYSGASDERRASYADDQGRIDVYINAYGVQREGRELVFHANVLAPSQSWTSIDRWSVPQLQMAIASSPAHGRWIFAHTYVVGGHATPSAMLAQVSYGWSALRDPAPAGVVAFAAPCKANCSEEAARIEKLWAMNGEALSRMIPRARSEAAAGDN